MLICCTSKSEAKINAKKKHTLLWKDAEVSSMICIGQVRSAADISAEIETRNSQRKWKMLINK